jgi:hypothetical protein
LIQAPDSPLKSAQKFEPAVTVYRQNLVGGGAMFYRTNERGKGRKVFVPFALPGEAVIAGIRFEENAAV